MIILCEDRVIQVALSASMLDWELFGIILSLAEIMSNLHIPSPSFFYTYDSEWLNQVAPQSISIVYT